jgi:thiol-disulfide isomerase/thioredoxin
VPKNLYIKLLIALVSLSFTACSSAQEIEVIKLPQLEIEMKNSSSQITVINFWATWCKPCIEEIPMLEEFSQQNQPQDAQVLLVSMDFASQKELVNQFVKTKEIKTRVVLLDETDYDSWISKIDSTWSGAIPATIIINNTTGKTIFYEGSLSRDLLLEKIEQTKN